MTQPNQDPFHLLDIPADAPVPLDQLSPSQFDPTMAVMPPAQQQHHKMFVGSPQSYSNGCDDMEVDHEQDAMFNNILNYLKDDSQPQHKHPIAVPLTVDAPAAAATTTAECETQAEYTTLSAQPTLAHLLQQPSTLPLRSPHTNAWPPSSRASSPLASLSFKDECKPVSPASSTASTAVKAKPPVNAVRPFNEDDDDYDESDDDERHDDNDNEDESSSTAAPQPTKRRKAHNLIEKKYRKTINDCVETLKEMLGPDQTKGKMTKASTLNRAIDEINRLRHHNRTLREQNSELRQRLSGLGQPVPPSSPGSTCSSSPLSSPGSSSADARPAPRRSRATPRVARRQMGDRAKVTLSVLLLCVLSVNPFAALLDYSFGRPPAASLMDDDQTPIRSPGRRLNWFGDYAEEPASSWWDDELFRLLCLWLLNGVVVICVLARLLVYGEPITEYQSASWMAYVERRTSAAREIKSGNNTAASGLLAECLTLLGRPLPTAPFDEWASLVWQCARHVLNLLYVGHWLPKQKTKSLKGLSVNRSTGEAAIVYDMLHQLDLSTAGCTLHSHVQRLAFSMAAVNLAEACDSSAVPRETLIHMYLHAAIRCKLSLTPVLGNIASWYFMWRARLVLSASNKQRDWLLSPEGGRYWSEMSSEQLACTMRASNTLVIDTACDFYDVALLAKESVSRPLSRLLCGYKIYLMQQVTQTALEGTELDDCARSMRQCRVLCEHDTSDEQCVWWAHLLYCATLWLAGDLTIAAQKYSRVRAIPHALVKAPLAMAVGHAFCARKLCLVNKHQQHADEAVLMHAQKAYEALGNVSFGSVPEHMLKLQLSLTSLCHDWLLASAGHIWLHSLSPDMPHWRQPAPHSLLLFHRLLVKRFEQHVFSAGHMPQLKDKLVIYVTCGRMMAGAQPLATWQALADCHSARLTQSDRHTLGLLLALHSTVKPLTNK